MNTFMLRPQYDDFALVIFPAALLRSSIYCLIYLYLIYGKVHRFFLLLFHSLEVQILIKVESYLKVFLPTLLHSNLYHLFYLISDNLLFLQWSEDAAVVARAAELEVNLDFL